MTTVLTDWEVRIDLDAALRGQAADPEELRVRRPRIVSVAAEAVREAGRLVSPVVLSRSLAVRGHGPDALELETGRLECGAWVAGRLAEAQEIVAVVCTIGHALEDRVSAIFQSDPSMALALDGAGSAAVDTLAAEACERFRRESAGRGLRGTVQCWPGSTAWPTEAGQPLIFGLVDPDGREADNVRLLPSLIMRPVKSVAFILGLTAQATASERQCESCSLDAVCRYRPREPAGR
jgi:hypothetical protein